MTNVEQFPPMPPDRKVWVCGCGCRTHVVFDDGGIECADCGAVPPSTAGGWAVPPEGPDLGLEDGTHHVTHGSASDFNDLRMAQRVSNGEFDIVIGISGDSGHLTTHGAHHINTDSRRAWLSECLAMAEARLTADGAGK